MKLELFPEDIIKEYGLQHMVDDKDLYTSKPDVECLDYHRPDY